MKTQRIKTNRIKGVMLFGLFVMVSLKCGLVTAQTHAHPQHELISQKVKTWEDSMRKLNPKKYPTYMGGELSLSVPQFKLKSNLPELSGRNVRFIGTTLGGVLANPSGKIKANAGMYYSDASVPYTIDMLQGGLSASIYVLRLRNVKYHTFEPYVSVGVSYQQSKFYGNYLPTTDIGAGVSTNYSSMEAPLLGKTGSTLTNITTGVEYQLESDDNRFIHLFAEASYGVLVSSSAFTSSFAGTTPHNRSSISVGISVGIVK